MIDSPCTAKTDYVDNKGEKPINFKCIHYKSWTKVMYCLTHRGR